MKHGPPISPADLMRLLVTSFRVAIIISGKKNPAVDISSTIGILRPIGVDVVHLFWSIIEASQFLAVKSRPAATALWTLLTAHRPTLPDVTLIVYSIVISGPPERRESSYSNDTRSCCMSVRLSYTHMRISPKLSEMGLCLLWNENRKYGFLIQNLLSDSRLEVQFSHCERFSQQASYHSVPLVDQLVNC